MTVLGDVDPGVDLSALERQDRAGVPHYRPGQHRAEIDGDVALLIYVDHMGHACVVPCERAVAGALRSWVHLGAAYRTGANGVGGWRSLPAGYKLSNASLRALDDAEGGT